MDLEEGSSRTGRGMKSLDSLYQYGFIIMKQISKTKFPPNELRLIQAFREKHKYIQELSAKVNEQEKRIKELERRSQ